ncbi:MAG: hypothetical protein R2912_08655 [Eubacteriales bacterium]
MRKLKILMLTDKGYKDLKGNLCLHADQSVSDAAVLCHDSALCAAAQSLMGKPLEIDQLWLCYLAPALPRR